jgi:hypothetical protein
MGFEDRADVFLLAAQGFVKAGVAISGIRHYTFNFKQIPAGSLLNLPVYSTGISTPGKVHGKDFCPPPGFARSVLLPPPNKKA